MLGPFCVNDNKDVDISCAQTMTFIICYNIIVFVLNPKTKARKGIILYNKLNKTTATKKHVDENHFCIEKDLRRKCILPLKKCRSNQQKRGLMYLKLQFPIPLLQKIFSRKVMCSKRNLCKIFAF